ncbi:beta-mannanase [Bacillus sp. CGMCC 1.16607]|uniref:beta-mannanase n=1 Tax=Bacillus sp. CGMCC 1.16607 TaxID=3351842 RepID=UPI00363EBFD2
MKWEHMPSNEYEIKELQSTLRDSTICFNWYWPKEVDFVYIYKTSADDIRSLDELNEGDLKLYTKEEYKVKKGYEESLDGIGRFAIRVYPCMKQEGKLILLNQEDEKNLLLFSTGRAKIYYDIAYKKKLFQSRKNVKMTIMSEIPVPHDVLCYVKKNGAVPVSIDDGTLYPFIRDFTAGQTVLPEIELEKNEYIRIFFKNGKSAAHHYELIPK